MSRILLVEDERDLALGLRTNLEIEGHVVEVAPTVDAARVAFRRTKPDLVILDLMLPDGSGFDLLPIFRQPLPAVPVLILSARVEEVDKIRGFRAGADDYVVKPFGVMELMLRVKALLRRSATTTVAPTSMTTIGSLAVNFDGRVVRRGQDEIVLSPKAFDLLAALHRRRGEAASRHDLLRDVWGYSADVTTRTVDTHIAELRRKLEDDSSTPQLIITVWKVGYRLRA